MIKGWRFFDLETMFNNGCVLNSLGLISWRPTCTNWETRRAGQTYKIDGTTVNLKDGEFTFDKDWFPPAMGEYIVEGE